jgi:hypothetical protein
LALSLLPSWSALIFLTVELVFASFASIFVCWRLSYVAWLSFLLGWHPFWPAGVYDLLHFHSLAIKLSRSIAVSNPTTPDAECHDLRLWQ